MRFVFTGIIAALATTIVSAQSTSTTLRPGTEGTAALSTSTADISSGRSESILSRFGMNYFTFYEGPSLGDGRTARNEKGGTLDSGMAAFTFLSITYKITERINFDHQTRFEYVHTNDTEMRFQGMRIGISGNLAKGEKWSLKGAANTDIPGLNGRNENFRTTIFNPGLFAGFNYQFDSRWSVYSIVSPRIYFYRDDQAVEPEWAAARRSPGEKRRIELRASPTINYAINDNIGYRTGVDLNFMNLVGMDAMEFKRWPTAVTTGPTFKISKMLNLYPYVQFWPFDGKKTTMETTSLGMWLNGVVF